MNAACILAFYSTLCKCVCVCTCGAGGLSICGLRICKASSRGVCFFLNFPSGLLNTFKQCQHQTIQFAGFSNYKFSVPYNVCVCTRLCVNTIILVLCAHCEEQRPSQSLLAVCCSQGSTVCTVNSEAGCAYLQAKINHLKNMITVLTPQLLCVCFSCVCL